MSFCRGSSSRSSASVALSRVRRAMALSSAEPSEIFSRMVRSSCPICPSICAISACSRSIDFCVFGRLAQLRQRRPELTDPFGRVAHARIALRLGGRTGKLRTRRRDGTRVGFDREREFHRRQALAGELAHGVLDAAELQHRDQGCDRGQGRDHHKGEQKFGGDGPAPGALACAIQQVPRHRHAEIQPLPQRPRHSRLARASLSCSGNPSGESLHERRCP